MPRWMLGIGVAVAVGIAASACSGRSTSGTATPTLAARSSTPVPTPTLTVLTGTGFTLDVPPNPTGAFDVKVNLADAKNYAGFSIGLSYDAAILKVTGADNGTLLGAASNSFCAPPLIKTGKAELACTLVGSSVTSASGIVAVFHFQAVGKGTTPIHFTTYPQDSSFGTFLVGPNPTGDPIPIIIATHDATVTVAG